MAKSIDRRAFLKTAAGAGTVLAAPNSLRSAGAGMYISMNGSLTGGKVAWPDFARLAARTGFGGVDVNLGAAMKEGVEATRSLFAEIKIRASNTGLPVNFNGNDEVFRTGLSNLAEAGKFAAAIQCPVMLCVLPPSTATPKPEMRKILKDRFTAIGETLQPSGTRVALEFLGPLHFRTREAHEFIWRMDETLAFAKECGPNVGLLLDVWHWYHAGATTGDIAAAGTARILHVHLSDCIKQTPQEVRDNQRVLPGEGVIDLMSFFGALKKIGYAGGVSPEPLGRIPKEMTAEEGAHLGLETAQNTMRKAGVPV